MLEGVTFTEMITANFYDFSVETVELKGDLVEL